MNVASQAVSLFDDGAIVSGELIPDCLFAGYANYGIEENYSANIHTFAKKALIRNIYLYNGSLTNTREVSILVHFKNTMNLTLFRRTLNPKETVFLEQLNWVVYATDTAEMNQPYRICINAASTNDTTTLYYYSNGAYIT